MEKLKVLLGTKVRENKETLKSALNYVLVSLIGFLFGDISIPGGLSPFGTGLVAAVPLKYILCASIGSAVGYAVFFGLSSSLRFVGAICLTVLIRLGFSEKITLRYKTVFTVALSFLASFASSLAVFTAVGGEGSFIILSLCEASISAVFSLFTLRISKIATTKKRGTFFAPSDTASLIFFGCIILLSLSGFSIFSFSFARCIAFFIIMLFALCGREASSSIAGVCCALTLGFSDTHPHLMLNFILSGLMTGLTGLYGKLPLCMSLVFSSVLSLILAGEPSTAIISLTEVILAGVIFFLVPEKLLYSAVKKATPLSRDAFDEERGRTLHFDLIRKAKAIRDISHSVNAVSGLLQKNMKPSREEIGIFVKEDICKGCTKYDFCWNKCTSLTKKAFGEADKILQEKGKLSSEELPDRLSLICRLPDKITESFNTALNRYEASLISRNEIAEAKRSAVMQFSCLAGLIEDSAEKIYDIPQGDPVLSATLTPFFKEKGFSLIGLNAHTKNSGKSILQLYCKKVPPIKNMSALLQEIYTLTGISYLKPVSDEYSEEGTVLSFYEEGGYSLKTATASITVKGEALSGDTYESFYDGEGCFYAVLSDGMGTGTCAAIDSVMTCSLISRLLRAGFSVERAFEAVNCALLMKSADETLSTLDIFRFDLESGEATFFKAGAAASIISKDARILAVEKSSMPLGIIRDVKIEQSSIRLSQGDIVILMSDGASVIPNLTLKELINKNGNDIKTLSELISDTAVEFSPSGRHDDITVACIKIEKE